MISKRKVFKFDKTCVVHITAAIELITCTANNREIGLIGWSPHVHSIYRCRVFGISQSTICIWEAGREKLISMLSLEHKAQGKIAIGYIIGKPERIFRHSIAERHLISHCI